MFKPKKYKSNAEKQRAYRIRHGQKPKVPLEIRRGQPLGSSDTTFRDKKEDETWEEYAKYIHKSIQTARRRQEKASGTVEIVEEPRGVGSSKRANKQQVIPETYYERRKLWEEIKAPKKMKNTRRNEK